MSFDVMVPARGQRGAGEECRVRIARQGTTNALTLTVSLSGPLAQRLGWQKGQRVHLGVGATASPDAGRLSLWAAEDGNYCLCAPGAAKSVVVVTRTLHPSLSREPAAGIATVVLAEGGRLIAKIPTACLRATSPRA